MMRKQIFLAAAWAALWIDATASAQSPAPPPSQVTLGRAGNVTLTLGDYGGDPYTSHDALAVTGGQMSIRGLPYGYYDTGTLLSINATNRPIFASRAGVNGGYEQGVPAMAGDPDFDLVAFYDQVGNTPPRLVLHGVRYDATHVYPAKALTPAELARLRPSMWISTNAVDPAIPTVPRHPHELPPTNRFGSTITGWAADGSSITVSGWTVPGGGNATRGQVPPGTLDALSSATPTVSIGAATKAFTNNWVLNYDPNSEDAADSQIRQFEGLELDLWNFGHQDYAASFHGITIGYDPFGVGADGHHVLPTADSYDLYLAGPMPTMLKIDGGSDSTLIDSGSLLLRADRSPALEAGSTNVLLELLNQADTNHLRLLTWAVRDSAAAPGGWPTVSLHVGLHVDGAKGTLEGSAMGEVVYNPPGYPGAVALRGTEKYGVYVESTGRVKLPQGLIAEGPVQLPVYLFDSLPRPEVAGREVFCSDCRKPGEKPGAGTGMPLFDDGHGHWFTTAGTPAAR